MTRLGVVGPDWFIPFFSRRDHWWDPGSVTCLLVIAVSGVLPTMAESQTATPIPLDPPCYLCTVELEHIVTIGDSGDGFIDRRPSQVIRLGDGRFLVLTDRVLLYESTGAFIREVGRRGGGPGEFKMPWRVFRHERDTLVVHDPMNTRISVFDSAGRYVSSHPWRGKPYIRGLWFGPDTFIVNASYRTPMSVGFPFHAMDGDGNVLHSFGADTPRYMPGEQPQRWRRAMARESDSSFWAAHDWEYRIEEWLVTGLQLRRVLERSVPWFSEEQQYGEVTPRTAPMSSTRDLARDAVGNLRILVSVADPGWKSSLGDSIRRRDGSVAYRIDDYQLAYDTFVEIVSPGEGRVLASNRFDQYLRLFVEGTDGGMVVAYRITGVGPVLDIYAVSYSTP